MLPLLLPQAGEAARASSASASEAAALAAQVSALEGEVRVLRGEQERLSGELDTARQQLRESLEHSLHVQMAGEARATEFEQELARVQGQLATVNANYLVSGGGGGGAYGGGAVGCFILRGVFGCVREQVGPLLPTPGVW